MLTGVAPAAATRVGRDVEPLLQSIDEVHVRGTLEGEQLSRPLSEPAPCTGDEDVLPCETAHLSTPGWPISVGRFLDERSGEILYKTESSSKGPP